MREAGTALSDRSSIKSLTMKSLLYANQYDVLNHIEGEPTEKVSNVNCGARVPETVRDVAWV